MREPAEVIGQLNKNRVERAKKLLELRSLFDHVKPISRRNEAVRTLIGRLNPYWHIKPTISNLRQLARDLWHYSLSSWSNPYDTEYYSA